MKKIMTLVLLFSACALSTAYASKEVGNGGNGLLINGEPIVLDLIEAGVDNHPFFDESVTINPMLLAEIKKSLPQFPETHHLLAQKLSEIEKVSQPIAWALTESFHLFNFRAVNEVLVNIHDDDSVVDYDPSIMIQLAIRRGTSIFLNGTWWSKMKADQKTALLLHEMIYAFQKPVLKQSNGVDEYVQLSTPARAITGFLFTSDLKNIGGDGLKRVLFEQNRLEDIQTVALKTPLVKINEVDALSTDFLASSSSIYNHHVYLGELNASTSEEEMEKVCKQAKNDLDIASSVRITLNFDPRLGVETYTNWETSFWVDPNPSNIENQKACVNYLITMKKN